MKERISILATMDDAKGHTYIVKIEDLEGELNNNSRIHLVLDA